MPIEIRELVVKVRIGEETVADENDNETRESRIIDECVAQVLTILKETQER